MTHYYSEKQDSEEVKEEVRVILNEEEYIFKSSSGVFSKKKLDNASKLLIEKAQIDEKDRVLDLGCGIGVIGIILKIVKPDIDITLSDVNERALKLARENIEKYNVEGKVLKSDLFNNIEEEYNVILSNPPMVAGRDKSYQLIRDSYKHLKTKGSIQIVARHKKGGAMLEEKLKEVYGNCEVIGKGSGFRVYKSRK